jgi:hypothetical protein
LPETTWPRVPEGQDGAPRRRGRVTEETGRHNHDDGEHHAKGTKEAREVRPIGLGRSVETVQEKGEVPTENGAVRPTL